MLFQQRIKQQNMGGSHAFCIKKKLGSLKWFPWLLWTLSHKVSQCWNGLVHLRGFFSFSLFSIRFLIKFSLLQHCIFFFFFFNSNQHLHIYLWFSISHLCSQACGCWISSSVAVCPPAVFLCRCPWCWTAWRIPIQSVREARRLLSCYVFIWVTGKDIQESSICPIPIANQYLWCIWLFSKFQKVVTLMLSNLCALHVL